MAIVWARRFAAVGTDVRRSVEALDGRSKSRHLRLQSVELLCDRRVIFEVIPAEESKLLDSIQALGVEAWQIGTVVGHCANEFSIVLEEVRGSKYRPNIWTV